MKKTIEGVEPKNRDYLKEELQKISIMFNVNFEGMKAIIKYDEPYSKSISTIETKAKHIKQFKQLISDFVVYQFNKNIIDDSLVILNKKMNKCGMEEQTNNILSSEISKNGMIKKI